MAVPDHLEVSKTSSLGGKILILKIEPIYLILHENYHCRIDARTSKTFETYQVDTC